jgi:hypothetical protein
VPIIGRGYGTMQYVLKQLIAFQNGNSIFIQLAILQGQWRPILMKNMNLQYPLTALQSNVPSFA